MKLLEREGRALSGRHHRGVENKRRTGGSGERQQVGGGRGCGFRGVRSATPAAPGRALPPWAAVPGPCQLPPAPRGALSPALRACACAQRPRERHLLVRAHSGASSPGAAARGRRAPRSQPPPPPPPEWGSAGPHSGSPGPPLAVPASQPGSESRVSASRQRQRNTRFSPSSTAILYFILNLILFQHFILLPASTFSVAFLSSSSFFIFIFVPLVFVFLFFFFFFFFFSTSLIIVCI